MFPPPRVSIVPETVTSYALADLGIFLYIRADIVILGLFNYINEIAYYELANRIFMLLALPFAIFSQVIAPNITRLFVNKEYNKIKFVIKRYFIYSIIIAAIISLLSYLIVKPLIIYFLPHYDNNY